MRWQWLWRSAVLVFGLQAFLASTVTIEEQQIDAQSLGGNELVYEEEDTLHQPTRHKRGGLAAISLIASIVTTIVSLTALTQQFAANRSRKNLLEAFERLSDQVEEIEHNVNGIKRSLKDLTNGMQHMVRWEITLNTLEKYTRRINILYMRFRTYQRHKDNIEDYTLLDFANAVVSHDSTSVMSLMANLHSMASSPEATALGDEVETINPVATLSLRPRLFRMLQDALSTNNNCHLHQSQQQLMERLYIIYFLTEARGFMMLEFAWIILRMHKKGSFIVEQAETNKLLTQYSTNILNEAKSVLKQLPRDFYKCDPQRYQEGQTYIQLTELLQGYIENEVDMNSDGSCSQTCGDYQHAQSEGCFLPESQYCGKHRRCRGMIHGCRFYDPHATACISKSPYRRYDFIDYGNSKHLGSHQRCKGTKMDINSWTRFLYRCSYCLCLCDDGNSTSSDRYISLVPAISDIQDNMVVTGVRFTKRKQVIHIQIRQGKALPKGQIRPGTTHWVETEPIEVKSGAYTEGQDYKKLSFEERSINLDRLEGPKGHAVTGVRFRMLGSHINLEVKITPISYTSGEMQPDRSYWKSEDFSFREELEIHSPDDPTKFPDLHKIDSQPGTFIRFVPTDLEKDVAQLTVPFFDSQPVAPIPGTWLSGIELFHKGQPGSGGFLAMKVMTYDMTPYMYDRRSQEPSNVVLLESQ